MLAVFYPWFAAMLSSGGSQPELRCNSPPVTVNLLGFKSCSARQNKQRKENEMCGFLSERWRTSWGNKGRLQLRSLSMKTWRPLMVLPKTRRRSGAQRTTTHRSTPRRPTTVGDQQIHLVPVELSNELDAEIQDNLELKTFRCFNLLHLFLLLLICFPQSFSW